jgi:hypothetical protein
VAPTPVGVNTCASLVVKSPTEVVASTPVKSTPIPTVKEPVAVVATKLANP